MPRLSACWPMMKGCILGCRYVGGCARGGRRRIVEDLANNSPLRSWKLGTNFRVWDGGWMGVGGGVARACH